jgi:hypothetical protein
MSSALMDPRGRSPDKSVSLTARRVSHLEGKTIGLMSNTKPNSARLLDDIGELLVQRYGVRELVKRQKPNFYTPAPPDMVEDLANSCDAVLTAIGD